MSQDSWITIQAMQSAAQQYPDMACGLAGVLMLVGLAAYLVITRNSVQK